MPVKNIQSELKRRVIEENLAFLLTYGHQTLVDFINHINHTRHTHILVGGDNQVLLAKIRGNINSAFPEQDLINFADLRRVYGPQHIFLYKAGRQDLTSLRNHSHLKRLLLAHDLTDCYNNSQLIWDSPKPTLASVIHEDELRNILTLKWVETRTWSQKVGAPPSVQVKKERSVNFFRINLDTRECELSIQKVNPNPRLALQEEHDLYIGLIKKLLGIDQLHRVNLEPVIKHLLDSRSVRIRSWKVAYERGGYLRGAGDPNLAQRINLFLTPFIGMELNSVWPSEDTAGAFTSMDAKNDEIFIHNHFADQAEMNVVLHQIRQYSEIRFHNSILKELATTHERLEPALAAIDAKISRSGRDSIDCKKLAEDHWILQADMLEAVEALVSANSKMKKIHILLKVKYQVICPETNKPVLNGDKKPVEFDSRKDIPSRIDCGHAFPTGAKKHPTSGNIRPIIKVLPAPGILDIGMLGIAERPSGLLSFMQKHFGKKFGLKTLQTMLALICSLPFFFIAYLLFKIMLLAVEQFPNQQNIIVFAYVLWTLVLVLILFMFLITLFGNKVMSQAVDTLNEFFESLNKFIDIVKNWFRLGKHQIVHKKRALGKPVNLIKRRHAVHIK